MEQPKVGPKGEPSWSEPSWSEPSWSERVKARRAQGRGAVHGQNATELPLA